MIVKKAFARVGLMGNPSDCFYGKTLSTCIGNFWAEVFLTDSWRLCIIPHQTHDPTEFSCLEDLVNMSSRYGYYGGLRLITATCTRFSGYCREKGIELDERNYTIRYDTNIPRQVGLGGSSAIIVALLKALMEFYGLTDADIPLEIQPNLVLSVEAKELEITAGLQDRVVQTYGGTVFMNFDKQVMGDLGHGIYVRMDSSLLPKLFIAYMERPGKTSGRMHNPIRYRFDQGDSVIVEAMCNFMTYASQAKQALEEEDLQRFAVLMNKNFDLRRQIYGDGLIGERNLRMIQIARAIGVPAKFPGSGGAVVGVYSSPEQCNELFKVYKAEGYKFTNVSVGSG